MGACSSSKKPPSKLDRHHRDAEPILCSSASEGIPHSLPAARPLHPFSPSNPPINDFDYKSTLSGPSPSLGNTIYNKPAMNAVPSILQDSRLSVSYNDEEEALVRRLANGMHRLGRAYQRESSYMESLKWLKSSFELYDYLSLHSDLLICEGDIAVAYIAEGLPSEFSPSPHALSSKDRRISYLLTAISSLSKIAANRTEVANTIKKAKTMDTFDGKETSLFEALVETGHMLRLWLNDYNRALSLYEQALSLAPEKLSTYLFLGVTHKALGDVHESIKYYKQALSLDQYYAEAWVNLGNMYMEEFKDLPHAEKCYVQALKSLERSHDSLVAAGKVYCLLSEVFYEQGFIYNALETSMKGIGVDSICIDNFSGARLYAEKLGCGQLAEFLKQVSDVVEGREEVQRVRTDEIEGRFKSILLGALGELVQVCNRIVNKYHFTPSEAETLQKSFWKMTRRQLQCLQVLYDIIGA